MAARVDVRSDQTGSWSVVEVGKDKNVRATSYHRKRDAQAAARKVAQARGGGVVVIHARSGRVAEQQTVPAGRVAKAARAKRANRGRGRELAES